MNSYMVILYLIYGFVFILFGIYALSSHKKINSIFPLRRSIIFFGVFGITHGLSEWFTMLHWTGLYEDYTLWLFYISRILKSISFLMLIQFGVCSLTNTINYKGLLAILSAIFLLWFVAVIYILYTTSFEYLYEHRTFFTLSLRYGIALPAAILSFSALIYQALRIRALKTEWMILYIVFGITVLIYGILDGLFVQRADFFPANTFYNTWFNDMLGIPIQGFKIVSGMIILITLSFILRAFYWEISKHMEGEASSKDFIYMQKQLNQRLHDNIIQSLFVCGIQVEKLKNTMNNTETSPIIQTINEQLNESIDELRNIIDGELKGPKQVKTFERSLRNLCEYVFGDQDVQTTLNNHLSTSQLNVSNEVISNIYFIVQEALINIYKHSRATKITIDIIQELNFLNINIKDNGIGLNRKQTDSKNNAHGIHSMQERAKKISGKFVIKSRKNFPLFKKGTEIQLIVPMIHYTA